MLRHTMISRYIDIISDPNPKRGHGRTLRRPRFGSASNISQSKNWVWGWIGTPWAMKWFKWLYDMGWVKLGATSIGPATVLMAKNTYLCTHTYIYKHILCIYIYIHMYMYIYTNILCIYKYINIKFMHTYIYI